MANTYYLTVYQASDIVLTGAMTEDPQMCSPEKGALAGLVLRGAYP